jgi:60 kDa SS-A/Ro ribonucleoprotein
MKKYARHFGSATPQFQRIPGSEQVQNKAGGWAFPVTDETLLERFLIMGTAENTYYATARELTRQAATCIDRLLEDGKGAYVVAQIADISRSGRAPKNDPAIFALAMAIKLGDVETRRAAAMALPAVARTATHFYQFLEAVKTFAKVKAVTDKGEPILATGWGRVMKRAVQNWLDAYPDERLAYQWVKYRQRDGWTARDVLRKVKPKAEGRRNDLYRWAVGKHEMPADMDRQPPEIVEAFRAVQNAETWQEVNALIRTYNLPWEAIPSKWAKNLDVQDQLFQTMPIGATIRQLGRLTNIGLLKPGSDATKLAVDRITNEALLKRGRIHPMALYVAEETYTVGRGIRGHLAWTPVPEIVGALGYAYFRSFGDIEPSGKNIVIGVDVSGSMGHGGVMGLSSFLTHEAAFASALTLSRIEPNSVVTMFDTTCRMVRMPASIETLRQLKEYARGALNHHGGTDCAAPIVWAHQNVHDVDAFVIFTDHETWRGSIHPVEAVWQYRKKWNRPAKLVTQAFVPHGTSIGAYDDAAYLDVAGMDEAAPSIITDFLR